MPRKATPYEARLDAVRRVRRGGEVALAVAASVGVTARQIYRWEQEADIRRELGLDDDPKPPPPPTDTPLIADTDLKRLVDAVRDGLAPDRAMRRIGRHPSTWRLWMERAQRGDEDMRRVVDMVTRADADLEAACVLAVRKGGMGWQGPAWLLERRFPEVYSADAAAQAAAADDFSVEELVEVVEAAGLLAQVGR